MGIVYEATQISVNRPIALKILQAGVSRDTAAVRRFRREAQIIANLSHPNIVTLIDFGQTEQGELFLAMELVRGILLADGLRDRGPLPANIAVSVVSQVLHALEHAHASGVVHRDLKPSNVILMEAGEAGVFVKLLDFGIAKILDEPTGPSEPSLTATGVVVGTPYYIAPEQIAGGFADARSDIYAAGLMLYELLSGAAPFQGVDSREVMMRQLYEEVPALPPAVEKMAPAYLAAVIARATRKRPEDRFQSTREMRRALSGPTKETVVPLPVVHRSTPDEPVARPRDGKAETTTSFESQAITGARRRLGLGGAFAVLLFVGGAALTIAFLAGREGAPTRGSEPRAGATSMGEPEARRAIGLERAESAESASARRGDFKGEPIRSMRAEARASARRSRESRRARAEIRRVAELLLARTDVSRVSPRVAVTALDESRELVVKAWCSDTDKPCWAMVSIDGGEPEETRVVRRRLKDGAHTIRVDKEGYDTVTKKVRLDGKPLALKISLMRSR